MKTKYWLMIFGAAAAVCIALSLPLLGTQQARYAKITSGGQPVRTVDLMVDQEFTVDGKNTVTVQDGKIAVTWANCPDGYCVRRGFCSSGGDIVCLPNRLVIKFVDEQEIDAVS